MGDGNNVAHSLMVLGAKAGVEVAVATPAELAPHPLVAQVAGAESAGSGGVTLTADPAVAAEGAAAVYTDVWVSMGDDEDGAAAGASCWRPTGSTTRCWHRAREDAVALHCLPAHPGEEITAEVLYGAALRGLGPGREPAARAEGALGDAHPRVGPRCAKRTPSSTTVRGDPAPGGSE